MAVAIETALGALPPEPVAAARARLRAAGTGYLRFALAEPGLFRTAFAVPEAVPGQGGVSGAGDSGLPPFQLLAAALDSLVAAGTLPPDRRPDAEYPAWTAVHGLDEPQLAAIGQRLLDMVERGL